MKNNHELKLTKSTHIEKSIYEKLTKSAFSNQMRIQPFLEKILSRVLLDKNLLKEVLK